jgi:hypothetical protein
MRACKSDMAGKNGAALPYGSGMARDLSSTKYRTRKARARHLRHYAPLCVLKDLERFYIPTVS